ncbi:MAG: phospho-sugar mutase [Ruminococcaceae bacterium]|nr:phospho-sugar mutase [Oscillospiraceae bacterium]
MDKRIKDTYELWCKNAVADASVADELLKMENDETAIEDAFYRELEFGTGGLRGVIGAGTNRMNYYTVAKASQGLANYVLRHFGAGARKIAVSYDSRIKSELFARTASKVFAANGIQVYIYPELMPTPCLSFATRELGCSAGIMITASHNPAKYNGYKVYGADGCQITDDAASEIFGEIQKIDVFNDVKTVNFSTAMDSGIIGFISDDVYTAFIEQVKAQSMLGETDKISKDVSIIYTPLNGTGLKPVQRALKESGFTNVTVVKEQEQPDGNFPTCPYPNPEIKQALDLGIEYARRNNAELLLATDPDCDRVGIALRDKNGEYELMSGNEVGMLLLDYICSRRIALGKMPTEPVAVKTIVTIDMAERIAKKYGVRTVNVLTGFKYIGEQIGMLERGGAQDSYIFGFEESYGYLSGSYVRDKDAVNAAFLICEMFAYYKARGIGLIEKLEALYREYGYCLNTLHFYEFEGSLGMARMKDIMSEFRKDIEQLGTKRVQRLLDYSEGIDGLPKSNVLKFILSDDCSVVVRPSGTEPKIKTYISVSAKTKELAAAEEQRIVADIERMLG